MPGFISHFYANWTNARGSRHDASLANGSSAHLRGWDAGVRVTPRNAMGSSYGKRYSEQDRIELAMTSGSRGENEGRVTALGRIVATPDGPRWEPAGPRALVPAAADGQPVIAAIPVNSHLNRPEPTEYACVVLAGRWPSGEPRFGTARLFREPSEEWTVTEHSDYWDAPMSQTEATTRMVEMTGHSRPPCTKPHVTR
jgi:hypothetical protein